MDFNLDGIYVEDGAAAVFDPVVIDKMILLDCEIVGAPLGIGDVFLEGDNLQTIDEDHSNYFIN